MPRPRHPGSPAPASVLSLTGLVVAATAGLTAAAALTARLVAVAATGTDAFVRVDRLIELVVLAAGAGVAWWLVVGLVTATVSASLRAAGRRWTAGERFVARHAPAVVRRSLALALGAGVGLASAVGSAGAQHDPPRPHDLGWVATQVGAAQSPTAASPVPPEATPPAGTGPVQPGTAVTVRPGDSLWRIAARDLPDDASTSDIAAAWPRWHEANRDLVGADPDLLHPGQVLVRPSAPGPTGGAS